MFITYTSDDEVIITTEGRDEEKMLREYFQKGGRDLERYEREEYFNCAVSVRFSCELLPGVYPETE
jgi:hypothetical protein